MLLLCSLVVKVVCHSTIHRLLDLAETKCREYTTLLPHLTPTYKFNMPSAETNGSNGTNGHAPTVQFFNVIDGKPRIAEEYHQVIDPRTEEPLWDAPIATAKDLDDAVVAANRAFKTWRKSTTAERQKAVHDVADVILKNVDILTEVQMRETGKSRLMSKFDVERAAWHFEYYSKCCHV